MGIIGKIFNPITKSEDLNKVIADYNDCVTKYKHKAEHEIVISIQQLYELRKKSVGQIQTLLNYVNFLENCPSVLIKGIDHAYAQTKVIREAWNFEKANPERDNISSAGEGATIGIAAAGAATATIGPSVAMAIATTFGTASTGAAISTLGGAAATNAALAWLGGGAVAAGGSGVAGGSAFLALLGPIGWSIAGATIIGGAFAMSTKNTRMIKDLTEKYEALKGGYEDLCDKCNQLNLLISKTRDFNNVIAINSQIWENKDYLFMNESSQKELFAMVNNAKTLGKMSNETIFDFYYEHTK